MTAPKNDTFATRNGCSVSPESFNCCQKRTNGHITTNLVADTAAKIEHRPRKKSRGRSTTKLDVLIVHSSPVIRLGLLSLINSSSSFRACGETAHAPAALEYLKRRNPHLILLGLTLVHGDGIALLKDLRRESSATPTLVITGRYDSCSIERAFRAGARGYVVDSDGTGEILNGLTRIAAGEFYASPTSSQLLLRNLASQPTDPLSARLTSLSDREVQIFRLIGAGFGASRLAAELSVSVKTIEAHRSHIKEKLGVASGAELNTRAADWLLETARYRFRITALRRKIPISTG